MDMNQGPVIIKFNNINVNFVSTSSGIAVGKNFMINWRSNMKNNFGLGDVVGRDNLILLAQTTVIDPDLIDNPVYPL